MDRVSLVNVEALSGWILVGIQVVIGLGIDGLRGTGAEGMIEVARRVGMVVAVVPRAGVELLQGENTSFIMKTMEHKNVFWIS